MQKKTDSEGDKTEKEIDLELQKFKTNTRKIYRLLESDKSDKSDKIKRNNRNRDRSKRKKNKVKPIKVTKIGEMLESDVFDDIETNFSFDDMGSDVSGYESYYGSEGTKKKKGPPRYPPLDVNKLYEVGLLAYTRDFHLGMLI